MEFKPLSGRQFPRFSAIKTFFRLPIAEVTDDFDIALFGTPFDGAVSYRPGARFAPTAVREASSLGRGFHWSRGVSLFDSERIADIGDCPVVPIDIEQTYARIEEFVTSIVKTEKKFVSCGGDHSTTLPVLRALRKHYGKPLAFIHFDAHLDTYPAAWGCEYHHGSFARHAIEEGLVDPKKTLHIGIRGPLAGGDDLDFVKKHGLRILTVDDVRSKPLDEVLHDLPSFDETPAYLTYDIDCLDPAYAPGTGTPVPGGLTTYETQRILRALKVPNLVGGDIVEISPPFDQSQITALAGVDAMFEIMCMLARK
ncbi:MAG TPA: agmatinase [Pseudobdellovibrionaceae bacterium]|nr:agmatinase [Pseudobdellovibrionaceae bacterium]